MIPVKQRTGKKERERKKGEKGRKERKKDENKESSSKGNKEQKVKKRRETKISLNSDSFQAINIYSPNTLYLCMSIYPTSCSIPVLSSELLIEMICSIVLLEISHRLLNLNTSKTKFFFSII